MKTLPPSAESAPTLDDVAALANVSTATVSRCLNAPGRVATATRKRVLEAVEALGYTPNFAAQVMAAKRTSTIGAIIPTMENAIFAKGLQAFQEALNAKRYTLLVASSAYSAKVEAEQIRALVARGADGLLLIGHDRDPAIYDYLKRQGVPALVAWSYAEDARAPCVGFDNRGAMSGLASEVIGLGHRNIALISGHTAGNDRARLRLEGIEDAFVAAGMDPADLNVVETSYEIERGAEAFTALMRQSARPTAVMCGNDVLAVGAVMAAQTQGLDIPGEVSITGFDDIELARITSPPVTTVHVPHKEMGHVAATTLIEMVETKGEGRATLLETRIARRKSLGPASQRLVID